MRSRAAAKAETMLHKDSFLLALQERMADSGTSALHALFCEFLWTRIGQCLHGVCSPTAARRR